MKCSMADVGVCKGVVGTRSRYSLVGTAPSVLNNVPLTEGVGIGTR